MMFCFTKNSTNLKALYIFYSKHSLDKSCSILSPSKSLIVIGDSATLHPTPQTSQHFESYLGTIGILPLNSKMEPAAYRSWTAAFKDIIPAPAPIPGGPVHDASDEQMEDSDKSIPPDTNWTVYSSSVIRGNLNKEEENNPRVSAGWHSPGKDTKLKELQEKLSKPWMAPGEPWAGPPVWHAPKENEA